VTLVSDARRKVMKDVLKDKAGDKDGDEASLSKGQGQGQAQQVLSRTIPPAVVEQFLSKVVGLEGKIADMLAQERCACTRRE
jgi:phage I-like protein